MWSCLYVLLVSIFLISLSSSTPLRNLYLSRNHISRAPKLSLAESAEWTEYNIREPEGPGTYSFGYDVEDSQTGNVQFRTEERSSNGTVVGSYGFVSPDGNVHVVHYVADHLGYRTKIEEARQSKFSNNYKSTKPVTENISPEMQAALISLGNMNQNQKEDQHVRPIDRETGNTFNDIPISRKNDENIYNVYFVPSNNHN